MEGLPWLPQEGKSFDCKGVFVLDADEYRLRRERSSERLAGFKMENPLSLSTYMKSVS